MKPKKNTSTPHYAMFRQFLKSRKVARDFMKIDLPEEFRVIYDFSTLKLENGSFVEESLQQYFSDVLYSLQTNDGNKGYIHVLIEHQSSPDKYMAKNSIATTSHWLISRLFLMTRSWSTAVWEP